MTDIVDQLRDVPNDTAQAGADEILKLREERDRYRTSLILLKNNFESVNKSIKLTLEGKI